MKFKIYDKENNGDDFAEVNALSFDSAAEKYANRLEQEDSGRFDKGDFLILEVEDKFGERKKVKVSAYQNGIIFYADKVL